jgi:hypothetical protein
VFIPRGFIGKILRFCKDQNISNDFLDEREKKDSTKFTAHITLKAHQEEAFNQRLYVDNISDEEHKELGVSVRLLIND